MERKELVQAKRHVSLPFQLKPENKNQIIFIFWMYILKIIITFLAATLDTPIGLFCSSITSIPSYNSWKRIKRTLHVLAHAKIRIFTESAHVQKWLKFFEIFIHFLRISHRQKIPSDYIQFRDLYFRLPTAGNGTNRCTIVLSVGGSDFARRIVIVRPTW